MKTPRGQNSLGQVLRAQVSRGQVLRAQVSRGRAPCGQVSLEYLMLTAAMLLILLVLVIVFMGQYAQQGIVVQQRTAAHSLSVLAGAAQEVWAAGAGAEQKMTVDIPDAADLATSRIAGRTLSLNISGIGDVSRSLPMNVSGQWPLKTGRFYASVYNNGTHVLIRPAGGLVVNITGIYMRIPNGGPANSTRLLISNRANVTYTLAQTLSCPSGTVSCAYDGTNGDLASGAAQTAIVTISSITPGLRAGYLTISAVPAAGSDLPGENITIPISIRVE